jgi:hypothetical protein
MSVWHLQTRSRSRVMTGGVADSSAFGSLSASDTMAPSPSDWGRVCVFYYCRTYYKAVRVGGGGEWRTGAMRDDEPRPVWTSLPITH